MGLLNLRKDVFLNYGKFPLPIFSFFHILSSMYLYSFFPIFHLLKILIYSGYLGLPSNSLILSFTMSNLLFNLSFAFFFFVFFFICFLNCSNYNFISRRCIWFLLKSDWSCIDSFFFLIHIFNSAFYINFSYLVTLFSAPLYANIWNPYKSPHLLFLFLVHIWFFIQSTHIWLNLSFKKF